MSNFIKTAVPLALAASILASCTTLEAYTGDAQISSTSKGALAGGLIGAVIGAATASKDERAARALIGAGIGGVAGGGVGYYMDQQEAELREELVSTGVQVKRTDDGQIELIMPGNITFEVNSADVSSDFLPTLASVANVLDAYENTLITVSGHTDSTGSDAFNLELSQRRATAVAQVILGKGVLSQRLAAQGFGEQRPIASNDTVAGRAQNRRVEITLDAIVTQ